MRKKRTPRLHTGGRTLQLFGNARPPSSGSPEAGMRVRLTRKLADAINGIDLSDRHVGDLLDLSKHDADVLVAEGWASHVDATLGAGPRVDSADNRPPRQPVNDRR